MKLASKDEVELQKIFMELPKTGITVVAFFATTSALILRLAPGADASPPFLFRILFLIGIIVTLVMFAISYNYLAQIVNNVSTICNENDRAKQVEELKDGRYSTVKNSITVAVLVWLGILAIFVFFL
ncbi:hypothetical protein FA743_17935 [Paracoccus gahaiensis]|uniref:Uncharacterized protein n=1 Tax=Paracoccus gahaiensis TaxID=1706839 RepID=A0A4U0R5Q3_9RHOB|nr:hypothetical protein [Paracoccus gahaiensis]TJZ89690.1 hypothetical protein FA743_17935 [Paracoccus gahaiensis]